ncbi:MAG: hypothetical protein HZA58_00035 [Acidimicrobiia bacterium]|nr:hypothetical protein [Acidimicrobiia bacterium]
MTHPQRGSWWRSPLVGTAIVVSALLVTGCGDDTARTATSVTTEPLTSSTSSGTTSPTGDTTATSTPAADPTLSEALAAVGARYRFTAVVDVGGVVTTQVDGTVYDGSGHYLVTSGGTTVEYIIGPSGQWARQAEGAWTVLSGPAPVADPLTPLAHPTRIEVVSSDAGRVVLDATYPASALGFVGSDEVVVTILIADGALAELRYQMPIGEDLATVLTTIDITSEVTPITAPTL